MTKPPKSPSATPRRGRDYAAELRNLFLNDPNFFKRSAHRPRRWNDLDFLDLLADYQAAQKILKDAGRRMPQVRIFDTLRMLRPDEYGKLKDVTMSRYLRRGREVVKSGRIKLDK